MALTNTALNKPEEEKEETQQSGLNSSFNQQQTQPVVPNQQNQQTQQPAQAPITSINQGTPQAQPQKFGTLNTTVNKQQVSAPKNQQQGTGYTNLNRIMQANQGNNLAKTIAGGVTSNISNLQSGLNKASQEFSTQAQANKVNTDQNISTRDSILNKLQNAGNTAVDPSSFQPSQQMQNEYNTGLSSFQKQLEEAKSSNSNLINSIQSQVSQAQKLAKEASDVYRRMTGTKSWQYTDQQIKAAEREARTRNARLAELNNSLGSAKQASTFAQDAITRQMQDYESNYKKQLETLQGDWIKSETERLMAENLPTAQEFDEFNRINSGVYSGPQGLENIQSLLNQAQKVEDLGTLSRLQGGRQELLKQFVGGRDYTAGQKNLDEAILGRSSNEDLTRATKQALGSERRVQEANKLAQAEAQGLARDARLFKEQTGNLVSDLRNPIERQIDKQLLDMNQYETQRTSDMSRLQGILSGSDPAASKMSESQRLNTVLSEMVDKGYMNPSEANLITGPAGLAGRVSSVGGNLNKLLAERLTGTSSIGADKYSAATTAQAQQLSALDRLLGKTSTPSQYGNQNYQKGTIGFDTENLINNLVADEAKKYGATDLTSEALLQQIIQQQLKANPNNKFDPSIKGSRSIQTEQQAELARLLKLYNAAILKEKGN